MNQTDKIIKSKRNTDIHATLVLSNDKTSKKGLIMVHGFKADRTEGGRFIELAHNLALKGINCICMSFPGCGDSTEDFFNYTLDNCLDDIDTCVNYMVENIGIDLKETGMVGYSMGGRLSCLYVKKHPEIKSVALWAAASYNSKPEESFQGSRFDEMIDEAKANGVCLRKNNFDNSTLNFSLDFLNNMLELKPADAIRDYEGNVLIVHGDMDDIVPLDVAHNTYNSLTTPKHKQLEIIKGANHGFGLWTDEMHQSQELVLKTTEYFLNKL